MISTDPTHEPRTSRSVATILSVLGILALCIWTIADLGGFTLTSVVRIGDSTRSVVSTFATVDHPFHAARADMLLQSLQHGELLRWIAPHQGGYPVEFYPLGIPWIDVGVWLITFGQFPIIAVHKLVVLLIFVLPVIGFWILARGDRAHPFVPLLALAIQVSVPGDWMHGGREELVYWGLIANVGGATFAFIMLSALSRWIHEGNRWYGILASIAATLALYTNTRSSVAIVVGAIAVGASALISWQRADGPSLRVIVRRIGVVALLSGLLTAPLLLAALRYADLYYFVNFESYADFAEIIWASKTAITPIAAWMAVGGVVLAFFLRKADHARSTALALALYFGLTVALSLYGPFADSIQQLETPRLMPYQRFLAIYLAAWFAGWVIERVATLVREQWRIWLSSAAVTVAVVSIVLTFRGTFGTLPEVYEPPIPWTTGYPELAQFEDAVTAISDMRAEDTAVFVVGDQMSWWHEQLWAPVWSDAMFFYDDWMWYWHPDHQGPYDPSVGHAYHDPAAAFTPEWFSAHGVGAVLVTNMPVPAGATDPRIAAKTNPNLEFQETIGNWDLYLVREPGSIVTNGDTFATSVDVTNNTIRATFDDASGTVEVRRNWFPRWEAFANGELVDVTRTASGYMQIEVPGGTTEVELRYAVTTVDWLGRIAAAVGVIGAASFIAGRPTRLWESLTPARKQANSLPPE